MRIAAGLLSLALLIGAQPASSLGAEPAESDRILREAVSLHLQGFGLLTDPEELAASIASASATAQQRSVEQAQKKVDRAIADKQLNLAKNELRLLELARSLALAEFSGPDQQCEREIIERRYREKRARLNETIREQRRFLGDRRGFLKKAWHRIGAPGRRILRAVFEEVAPIVASGGSVSGGVVRKLAIRAGREELKNAVLRGLARQISGGRTAVVAEARVQCQPGAAATLEATPAPTPRPGFDTGIGIVEIADTFGHPYAGAGMQWDHFLGETCIYYQAYNPNINNPFLPGVDVVMGFDLEAGTFDGIVRGPTHADEIGWDAWGRFALVIADGALTPQADGHGWDLTADAPVGLSYGMDGFCAATGGNVRASKVGETRGTATVEGEIDLVGDSWVLELRATRTAGEEKFNFGLRDIEVGRWGE